MAYRQPLVLENISLQAFVQYILDRHRGPSTLVICGPKDAFIEQLASAVSAPVQEEPPTNSDLPGPERPCIPTQSSRNPWAVPTLRLLSTSRTLTVAICPDITHLRAYLATYTQPQSDASPPQAVDDADNRILAILNPIELHRPTSAFSAQGLNRTFAGAVEAAYRCQSQLVVAECTNPSHSNRETEAAATLDENAQPPPSVESPWDEEVSVLNVTTKSFGAGERGWVGRTVKLRSVAARWCRFGRLDASS